MSVHVRSLLSSPRLAPTSLRIKPSAFTVRSYVVMRVLQPTCLNSPLPCLPCSRHTGLLVRNSAPGLWNMLFFPSRMHFICVTFSPCSAHCSDVILSVKLLTLHDRDPPSPPSLSHVCHSSYNKLVSYLFAYVFYLLSIIELKYKFGEGRTFHLFYLLWYPWYLEKYLACSSC